jgi:EmrB/QacA subfamily drug resistance transporter
MRVERRGGEAAVKRWTLAAVILGSGAVFLESTIVAAALPKIGEALSSTWLSRLESQAYVYYGYLLALSSLLILAGALTDYYGRRKLFMIGLIGFAVTSALCGVATSMEFLIAARILQGAAGAVLVPGSLSIISAAFQGEEQARAFGVWAGASAATTILGPVIGGALVAYISWRAAFFINIPLLALAAVWTSRYMPESRDEQASGHFDWLGAVIIALAVGGLTFGAIRGQAQGWGQVTPWLSLGVGLAAAIAFPVAMARSSHPLVPLDLFKSRNFAVTNLSTLLIYGSIYVLVQFMALFTIGILGYNEVGFGIATIPSTLFLALFSAKFGSLADRYGPRRFMVIGPAVMGAGLLWFLRMPADSAAWIVDAGDPSTWIPPLDYVRDVLPAQVIFGLGLMVMVAPLTTALMRSVPVRYSGVASAFNNAVSRVGPQLAGALILVAISASFYATLADLLPGVDISPEFRRQVSPLNAPDAGTRPVIVEAARQASTTAFHVAMLVSAVMCFLGALINAIGIRDVPTEDKVTSRAVAPCAQSPAVETGAEAAP